MVQFCRSPQIQEPVGPSDPILMDWILHLVYSAVVVYKGSPWEKKNRLNSNCSFWSFVNIPEQIKIRVPDSDNSRSTFSLPHGSMISQTTGGEEHVANVAA